MKKVDVDREKCIGCATCVNLCPEVFEMKEGKSSVRENAPEKCDCDLEEVAESCPIEAITISEEESK